MKKLLLTLVIASLTSHTVAQNIQLHWDFLKERNYPTITLEMFKPDTYGSTYLFVDMDFPKFKDMGLAYMELSRNQKLGSFPVLLHGEYNGGLFAGNGFGGPINNAWLIGASYPFAVGKANLEVQLNYKHFMRMNDKPNVQVTGVWEIPIYKDKITFSGFMDFWTENKFGNGRELVIASEPQLWYNFNSHLSLGTEIEISNKFVDDSFHCFPTLGAKWNF